MGNLRYFFSISLIVLLASCGPNDNDLKNQTPIELEQRPKYWVSNQAISLSRDSSNAWPTWTITTDKQTGQSIESLISQLWKLAFSGEVAVYEANIFGESDLAKPLDPNSLVKFLTKTDTTYQEDIETGELFPKVVETNFSERDLSAIVAYVTMVNAGNHFELHTQSIGLGSRIFNERGEYRGIRPEYFIQMEGLGGSDESVNYRLNIETDSTGLFRLSSIQAANDASSDLIQEMGNAIYGTELGFDYRNHHLIAVLRKQKAI